MYAQWDLRMANLAFCKERKAHSGIPAGELIYGQGC